MKNPITIKTKSTKDKFTTMLDISYNGKQLGRLGLFNVLTEDGTLGFRITWHEEGKGWNAETQNVIYDFTDKDELGNIRLTK